MSDEKTNGMPTPDSIKTLGSFLCALSMFSATVKLVEDGMPRAVAIAIAEAPEDIRLKERADLFVDGVLMLCDEFRGMTDAMIEEIARAKGMPNPKSKSMDARTEYAKRMEATKFVRLIAPEQIMDLARQLFGIDKDKEGGAE